MGPSGVVRSGLVRATPRPAGGHDGDVSSAARGGAPPNDDPDRVARRHRHPARHDRTRPRPGCRPAPPRGPGQADRGGQVRRRPRLPGRLVRPDDPLDRRPRDVRGPGPRSGLRLVEGRRRDRRRHPRRQHRQLDQVGPADPGAGRWRDPAPRGAAGPDRRAGSRDPARRPAPRARSGPTRCRRSSTRSSPSTSSRATASAQAMSMRPSRRRTSSSRASTASVTRSSSTSRTTR